MSLARPSQILAKSILDFFRDGGIMLAGALSYFFMMTVVPFSLFLIALVGYALGAREDVLKFLLAKLSGFFPNVTHEITDELKKLISYKKALGVFSIALYGFLSFQLFMVLQNALAVVFKIRKRRPFILSFLMALLMVTLIMLLLLVSFGATTLILMLNTLRSFFPDLKIGTITRLLISYVVPFFLVFIAAGSLYKLLPHRKIRISHAAAGALFTTLFLELAKHLFASYVSDIARFGTLYGPLSAMVMFLLWIFYSWCIFLIGAEVVHNCEVTEAAPKRDRKSVKKQLKRLFKKNKP